MTERIASCRCGQLRVTVAGDPVRVSVCHCLNCKKRSGSAFAAQARWPEERTQIRGDSKTWVMRGDSGAGADFHFCPECGTDVYYLVEGETHGLVAIPIGTFEQPFFTAPEYSVYEGRKQAWVEIVGQGIDRYD